MPPRMGPMPHPAGPRFRSWQTYLLSKPGASERHPFDPEMPVYFVKGKLFAIYSSEHTLNLKCVPDWSLELRRQHPEIIPGYHMNKKHWNTVDLKGALPRKLIKTLVDQSYDLVSGRAKALAKSEGKLIRARGTK